MAMVFTYPALVQVIGTSTYTLSDHNRSPLSEDFEIIEQSRRTAKGTRRKYNIAQKRTYMLSWDKLPQADANTVDGFAGADTLLTMTQTQKDTVTLRIKLRNGTNRDVLVHIVAFDRTYRERGIDDHYYDVSITFEEV